MNEGNTMSRDDGPSRRATRGRRSDDQPPEPHTETDDQPPEEAGYGYGV